MVGFCLSGKETEERRLLEKSDLMLERKPGGESSSTAVAVAIAVTESIIGQA